MQRWALKTSSQIVMRALAINSLDTTSEEPSLDMKTRTLDAMTSSATFCFPQAKPRTLQASPSSSAVFYSALSVIFFRNTRIFCVKDKISTRHCICNADAFGNNSSNSWRNSDISSESWSEYLFPSHFSTVFDLVEPFERSKNWPDRSVLKTDTFVGNSSNSRWNDEICSEYWSW